MGRPLPTAQLRILKTLYDRHQTPHATYGADLIRLTHLPSGTVYRALDALEDGGLVVGTWEDIDESAAGRRRRRYLELSAVGVRAYESELSFVAPRGLVARGYG
jgi:DNA-binding PadR family transcriptional regulator